MTVTHRHKVDDPTWIMENVNGTMAVDLTDEKSTKRRNNAANGEGLSGGCNGIGGNKIKKKEKPPMVSFCELFKYADRTDLALMVVGSLAAVGHGSSLPILMMVFGDMLDSFVGNQKLICHPDADVLVANSNISTSHMNIHESMGEFALSYCYLGLAVLLFAYLQMTLWTMAANRQVHGLRRAFYKSVLSQDMAWFDTHSTGELATEMANGIDKIQSGIGDKVGIFIQWMCCCLGGFAAGFAHGWKLTLVILAVSPLLALAAAMMSKFVASLTNKEMKAYARAGSIAEEAISSIRTVKSFNGEPKESERYQGHLGEAESAAIKRGLTSGVGMGITWFIMYSVYALGFWYGFNLVRDSLIEGTYDYTAGSMVTVFFCVFIGAFAFGYAAPNLLELDTARGAAVKIYKIIESNSTINGLSDEGGKPFTIMGIIQFENVFFSYPSRKTVPVLKGIHFQLCVGQSIALVGESGCGKSTIAQLMMRFYDPDDGRITLDGENIKKLNVNWARKNMGFVGQEPVLFTGTIAENIMYGSEDENCTHLDVEAAALKANAHDFIMMLPNKYETEVGERGTQLSGGQKQRIAIARALIRNPKILILDEATSALDNESQAAIQSFLRTSSKDRATLIIAHRLTTVINADLILVIHDGRIVEEGNHTDLLLKKQFYYNLVNAQTFISGVEGNLDLTKKNRLKVNGMVDTSELTTDAYVEIKSPEKAEDEQDPVTNVSMFRVMRYNKHECGWIFFGCFASLICGGIEPACAVLFSEILGVFGLCSLEEQERKISMYAMLFVVVGVSAGLAMFFQRLCFAKSGEALTRRIRQLTFESLLSQEMAYFDESKNNVGALTSRLATDASQLQGATGARLGTFAQSISNMGIALVIAFLFGWQLALLFLTFVPFIVISGMLQQKLFVGDSETGRESLETGSQVVTETISNIKTVASLTKENVFYNKFVSTLALSYHKTLKKAHLYGFSMSFSRGILYFVYAATFYLGGYLVQNDYMTYRDVFLVWSAVVFGAMGMGQANSFAPGYAEAKVSVSHIFSLLDRVPKIDGSLDKGVKLDDYEADILMSNLTLRYPTRQDTPVLNGFNVTVKKGQKIALVGSSGCGKSTVIQLLERFYDPDAGQILVGGFDLKSLNVPWLRSQIGIVSQGPVLFDATIRENIAYGDNSRNDIPLAEIIDASKQANIHDFISSLPLGYETCVGSRGSQLSGGQKQRVAIARAILKNPKILLLDEATSALDAESEEIVQKALDKASESRTCIVIAHRLSTIKNSDQIFVIHDGYVAESGTHNDLMDLQGIYYNMHSAQDTNVEGVK